jgi:hypothetical protein
MLDMLDMDFVSDNQFGTSGNFVIANYPNYPKSPTIDSREKGRKMVAVMYIEMNITVETAGKLLRQMEAAPNLPECEKTADIAWELFEALVMASRSPSTEGRSGIMYPVGPARSSRNTRVC